VGQRVLFRAPPPAAWRPSAPQPLELKTGEAQLAVSAPLEDAWRFPEEARDWPGAVPQTGCFAAAVAEVPVRRALVQVRPAFPVRVQAAEGASNVWDQVQVQRATNGPGPTNYPAPLVSAPAVQAAGEAAGSLAIETKWSLQGVAQKHPQRAQ
jgi:hypothetical protein